MQTEELRRSGSGQVSGAASPALQDRLPADWLLTDIKGRPVPLSTAGQVLYFRRSYRLWVAGYGPPPELRPISVPPFLKRQPGPDTAQRHGREYRCLTYRVEPEYGLLSFFRQPYEVRSGDWEMECCPAAGAEGSRTVFVCPVVARAAWSTGIVFLLVFGYLAGWLLQQGLDVTGDCLRRGVWPWEDVPTAWAANPRFWLTPILFALLNPLLCVATNLYYLRQRSAELAARFRAQYPSLI